MGALSEGLLTNDNDKVQDVIKHFQQESIFVEYNRKLSRIKLMFNGAPPLYFSVYEFNNKGKSNDKSDN